MSIFNHPNGPGGDAPTPNASNQVKKPEFKPGTIKKAVAFIVAAIIVIYLGSSSFYTVQEQERAAILTFGAYSHDTGAGLHFKWPYPIQQVKKVQAELTQRTTLGYREDDKGNVTVVDEESVMITGDENIVIADAVITWKIHDLQKYLFNIKGNHEEFLLNSASASVRSVIGAQKLDFAITDGKTVIQDEVRKRLIELQDKYETGIQIIDIKFQDIEPPGGEVEEAFRNVTNAREEKNTKINNATRYENDRIPKARGEAQALIENAEAEKKSRILNAQGDVAKFNAIYEEYSKNKNVTQSRLVLETLEKILPNAQIFITNSGSDTINYLPLNELLRDRGKASASQPTVQPSAQPQTETAPSSNDANTQSNAGGGN